MKTASFARLAAFTVLLGQQLPAQNTVINFDDFGPTGFTFVAANRYQSLGAVFDRDFPLWSDSWNLADFVAAGGTLPNTMPLSSALDTRRSIELHFFDPVTLAPATTDYVSALFFDSEVGSVGGELAAFDAAGNLLAASRPTTPPGYASTAIVSIAGIAWVRLSDVDDGMNIDNISFKSPSIPEPSTCAFALGCATAVFAFWCRRCRKAPQA